MLPLIAKYNNYSVNHFSWASQSQRLFVNANKYDSVLFTRTSWNKNHKMLVLWMIVIKGETHQWMRVRSGTSTLSSGFNFYFQCSGLPMHWIKPGGIWAKKSFLSLNFFSLFFILVATFTIEIDSMKKKFKFHLQVGFLGPLASPLNCILSEFSSSWKVPNVGSRLWLLQGHNLSTIVYYTMTSAKLSNTTWQCFIQCSNV